MSSYPPSWYAATANPAPDRPPLEADADCDVVIVGGGFTGLSTALALAQAGRSVRLLEAERVGWGASGRCGGQANPGLRAGPAELEAEVGAEQARRLIGIGLRVRDGFWDLIARHAIACDARRGYLLAAAKPRDMAALQGELATLERLAGPSRLRLLDAAAVHDAVGSRVHHGGLFDPDGGHVHPLNLALGLATAAEAAGAIVHERSRVLAIEGSSVRTAHGRVRAAHVVLATDAWTGDLVPALGRRLMNIGSYMVATEPLAEGMGVLPQDWAVADTKFVLDYFRRSADGRLIFAGGEKYRPAEPRDIAAFVRPHAERVFPQLRGIPIAHAWGGQVAITLSRHALVGRQGDIVYAMGYSGQGVMLATFMGTLIAEALAGTTRDFETLGALPTPAFPGGGRLRTPLHVAAMLWYALRDRL